METSTETDKLFTALSKAQGEIVNPQKDSKNSHYNSQYASLPIVIDVIRPVLSNNQLILTQWPESIGDDNYLVTLLAHTSGQFIKNQIKMLVIKKDPQGLGSAITYYRRYIICAIMGLHQADDDGNEHRKELEQQQKDDLALKKEQIALEKDKIAYERAKLESCQKEAQTPPAPAPIPLISQQQLEHLLTYVNKDDTLLAKLQNVYKVKTLGEINVTNYKAIIDRLERAK